MLSLWDLVPQLENETGLAGSTQEHRDMTLKISNSWSYI